MHSILMLKLGTGARRLLAKKLYVRQLSRQENVATLPPRKRQYVAGSLPHQIHQGGAILLVRAFGLHVLTPVDFETYVVFSNNPFQ
jgi:hypothetical protein